MPERPIIFSGPMVLAVLEGRKTQTRRVLNPQPETRRFCTACGLHEGEWAACEAPECGDLTEPQPVSLRLPYAVGDRLWVRERFSGPHDYEKERWPPRAWFTGDPIWYWADGNPVGGDWTRPKPSIHMPRWASRITLEVTDVRVQRLQEISEEDAVAEGFGKPFVVLPDPEDGRLEEWPAFASPRKCFAHYWGHLHGPGSWETNPWVVAIGFKGGSR